MLKLFPISFKARKLREIGTRLAFDGVFAENVNEVADEVMSELYEVVSEQHKKRLKTVGDIGAKAFESYSKDEQDLENRSHTGFSRLDEILKGMSAGNLIILAQDQSLGKPLLLYQLPRTWRNPAKRLLFIRWRWEAQKFMSDCFLRELKSP